MGKQKWLKEQLQREKQAAAVEAQKQTELAAGQLSQPAAKKAKVEADVQKAPTKPLEEDLVKDTKGHDLQIPKMETFVNVRTGWPKHAYEYPRGFEPCMPP